MSPNRFPPRCEYGSDFAADADDENKPDKDGLKMSSILTLKRKNEPRQTEAMKRYIILTILTILTVVPAMAQIDLSELNGMTDGQIQKTFGQPKEYTVNHEYTMSSYFRYDDMEIFYTQSHKSIDCFDISSARVKVLSNFIADGVRVGDKLSKIQNFDFSKTKYGRNKVENGLKTTDFAFNILDKYPVNYVIFDKEGTKVYLCVQNGIIRAISFISTEDLPYEGYDVDNNIFAKQ